MSTREHANNIDSIFGLIISESFEIEAHIIDGECTVSKGFEALREYIDGLQIGLMDEIHKMNRSRVLEIMEEIKRSSK